MSLSDEFKSVAATNKLSLEQQLEILLAFVEDNVDHAVFWNFVGLVCSELAIKQSRVGVASGNLQTYLASEPVVETPADTCQDMGAFFVNNLAIASLQTLHELALQPVIGKADTWRAVVPANLFAYAQDLLAGRTLPEGSTVNDILLGFKLPLDNGDWAAITIVRGVDNCYVDAYVALAAAAVEQHPTWPPLSLAPCNSIAAEFNFVYPDETHVNIWLVEEATNSIKGQ